MGQHGMGVVCGRDSVDYTRDHNQVRSASEKDIHLQLTGVFEIAKNRWGAGICNNLIPYIEPCIDILLHICLVNIKNRITERTYAQAHLDILN